MHTVVKFHTDCKKDMADWLEGTPGCRSNSALLQNRGRRGRTR